MSVRRSFSPPKQAAGFLSCSPIPHIVSDSTPQSADSFPQRPCDSNATTNNGSGSEKSSPCSNGVANFSKYLSPVQLLPRGSPLQSPNSAFSCYGNPTGYLSRLQSHPMFHDLQTLLSQECQHLQVPANLITANWNSGFSPTSPVSHTAHQVILHHIELQDLFLRLHGNPACRLSSMQLENVYCSEVGRVEMGRYQALCTQQPRQAVNRFYDDERLRLACRIRVEADKISCLGMRSQSKLPDSRSLMGVVNPSPAGNSRNQTNLPSTTSLFPGTFSTPPVATPVQLTSTSASTFSSVATPVQLISTSASTFSTSTQAAPVQPTSAAATVTEAAQLQPTSATAATATFSTTPVQLTSSTTAASTSPSATFTTTAPVLLTPVCTPSPVFQRSLISQLHDKHLLVSTHNKICAIPNMNLTSSPHLSSNASSVFNNATSVSSPIITSTSSPTVGKMTFTTDAFSDISSSSSSPDIEQQSAVTDSSISSTDAHTSSSTSPVTNTSASSLGMKTSPSDSSPGSDFLSPGDDSRGLMMSTPMLTPHEQTRQQRLHTTHILTEWYDRHVQYPYPSDTDVSNLCDLTNISPGQVRKWLANKRVRSFNTLSITGNDHPIKYKYQKQSADSPAVPTRRPQYKVLNTAAKKVLSDWFDCHVMNPYPTEEDKDNLARVAEISVSQVKSWFANKRSRTNNTRKQIPNYFIKKYPNCTPIVQMVVDQRQQRKQAGNHDRLRVSLFP